MEGRKREDRGTSVAPSTGTNALVQVDFKSPQTPEALTLQSLCTLVVER